MQRFTSAIGMPPIQYLTKWRLQTGQMNLRETRKSIAQAAHIVGYESEEAFSRAFKREGGVKCGGAITATPPPRARSAHAEPERRSNG